MYVVSGKKHQEHDKNLKNFMKVMSKYNLTLNTEKSTLSKETNHLLGQVISHKSIRPYPEKLQSLRNLSAPIGAALLQGAQGIFSHFAE